MEDEGSLALEGSLFRSSFSSGEEHRRAKKCPAIEE
jgi:hypothetical protein